MTTPPPRARLEAARTVRNGAGAGVRARVAGCTQTEVHRQPRRARRRAGSGATRPVPPANRRAGAGPGATETEASSWVCA